MDKQLSVIWDHTKDMPSFSNISVLFQKEFKYVVILLIDYFFFTFNTDIATPSKPEQSILWFI